MTSSKLSFIYTHQFYLSVLGVIGLGVLSIVIALIVPGRIRLSAGAAALLFGGVGVTGLLIPRCPSASGDFDYRTIEYDGQHHEAIIVPISRTRSMIPSIGMGVPMVASGGILVIYPISDLRVVFQFCGLGLVVCGLVLLWLLVDILYKPRDLALLPDGIRLPSIAGGHFVPWSAIHSIYLNIQGPNEYPRPAIEIIGTDRSKIDLSILARIGWMFRFVDYHVSIPIDSIGVSSGEFLRTTNRLHRIIDSNLRLEYIQQHSDTVQESN